MNNPKSEFDHNTIARKAYELYLARGKANGHEVEDWLRAETELRTTRDKKTVATKTTYTSKERPANYKARQ
mgnify:CR=1 FL=1